MTFSAVFALFLLVFMLAGCRPAETITPAAPTNTTVANLSAQREFSVRGVIRQIADNGKTAVIRHEEIPGYMPKMTMELTVRDPAEVRPLKPGDEISFKLVATADTHWIHSLVKTGVTTVAPTPPPNPPFSDPELKASDAMPDFEFLGETGQTVKFSDYRGRALAFTFIFTRCPLPDFCPRMGKQFADARKLLLQQKPAFTNWQLLSISFDPEFDRPAVLANYARNYRGPNADRWLFATAATNVLAKLAPLCDLKMLRESGSISHNLRTLVLAPDGRVFQVFAGNQWTAKELAEAMLKAAALRSGDVHSTP